MRKELGSDKLQLSELVVLGVEKKLERLREERADVVARREGLANWVLTRSIPVDLDAAAEVRQSGWARS
ncbi:MAG: hypothetical protein ACREN8_07345 [Candidatus Dormibacteraceae bacterium]